MNKILAFATFSLALSGCGADVEAACQAYIDAAASCAEEAYGADAATYALPDSTCDAYAGAKDQESADLLNCYADAYTNGDCSTAEGYAAAASAGTTDCAAGG